MMNENKLINDDALDIVSGGRLVDGWKESMAFIVMTYRDKYGDAGKQMVINLMKRSVSDPTSPIEQSDMQEILDYIERNYDRARPEGSPGSCGIDY